MTMPTKQLQVRLFVAAQMFEALSDLHLMDLTTLHQLNEDLNQRFDLRRRCIHDPTECCLESHALEGRAKGDSSFS